MDPLEKKVYHLMQISDQGIDLTRTPEEYKQLWKKYLSLPQGKQEILTDEQLPVRLKNLQDTFGLPDPLLWAVGIMTRKIFFGELDVPGCEAKIGSMLAQTGGGDPNKAKEITQFIDREILHLVPKPVVEESDETEEEGRASGTVRLPLLRAMTDFPQLGMMSVTANKIRVKGQAEPQRPTLSNWIRCYRDELGVGFHDEVQRGRFLFQSDNGRRLSQEERDRLNLILKSIEEDYPLDIDTAKQVIVFPARTAMPSGTAKSQAFAPASVAPGLTFINPNQPRAATPSSPQGKSLFNAFGSAPGKNVANETLHFSTGHVLPAEQTKATPVTLPPIAPAAPQPPRPAPTRNPYVIRPLRLRNDQDEKT